MNDGVILIFTGSHFVSGRSEITRSGVLSNRLFTPPTLHNCGKVLIRHKNDQNHHYSSTTKSKMVVKGIKVIQSVLKTLFNG